jgi:nucleoside-diphosphate-sugar epimerase
MLRLCWAIFAAGHYAVGNFIRDGLEGWTIVVHWDGKPRRSYIYAADLAVSLLIFLALGSPGEAYNLGSDFPVLIGELADLVSRAFGNLGFITLGEERLTDRNLDYQKRKRRRPLPLG